MIKMIMIMIPITGVGTLLIYVLGSLLPWHLAAAACVPVPILLVLAMARKIPCERFCPFRSLWAFALLFYSWPFAPMSLNFNY